MSKAKKARQQRLRKSLQEDADRERKSHPRHVRLSQSAIDRLRSYGLCIDDDPVFPGDHVAYPSGYVVTLPKDAGGNHMFKLDAYFGPAEQITVMPAAKVWKKGATWGLAVHEYAPGPGPGDFDETQPTEDSLIDSILSYFLDPKDPRFQEALTAKRQSTT